jgi:drug/metabolite transporter (DMT)-like permease
MFNLILAIVFSSFLYLIFKLFTKYNVNNSQAIVFNYIIAFSIGFLISPIPIKPETIITKPWFSGSIFLGFMFIYVFNILGKTTQVNGISVASVSSKMAMIIPILFGIIIFNENIGPYKILGILIALLAVYYTTKKEKGKAKPSNFKLPILLFIGAGIIDTSMNYIQHYFIKENEVSIFASTTFLFAFIFGVLFLLFKILKEQQKIYGKNILAGFLLGIPNYYSMFFLIKALQNKNLESATIFTLINIGVILLTTIFSILFFKEKLKPQNYIGILLAITAVFLVTN